MKKVRDVKQAVEDCVESGKTVMVGGFGRGGTPFTLIDVLAAAPDRYKDLTLYKNDANEPGIGIGKLLAGGQVKMLHSTHIGLNPDFIRQMNAGEVGCTLTPQGIFAEKIRAGGAGIAAFYSDIGMGTPYEEGKDTVTYKGQKYIVEAASRGDVALISADIVDHRGNCWWAGTRCNMNKVMAMACDTVIVEAQKIVPCGEIKPESVHLPGTFVTAVVQARPIAEWAVQAEGGAV